MNVTRAGSFFDATSQFLSSPINLAKDRRAQKGVSWPTCIFLPATAMMAPQSARVNGSTVFGGTVRMNAKRRLDAFFDAWATLLSEAMAENAWSASFGDASNENTMGALDVSGSKRRACVVAARRTSLRIAAAARWQRHWLLAQFCFMQGVAARRSQTQWCSYNFGVARVFCGGLNSQALPVPPTLIFANIIG